MPDRLADETIPFDETGIGLTELEIDARSRSMEGQTGATGALPHSVAARFGPELAQLLVVVLWSSTFVMTKAAFAEVNPFAFIFARFGIMLAFAFVVLLARERGQSLWIARADLGRFVISGLTGYAIYQLGFVLGLSRTSPFSSSLLIAMVPIFTVVILAIMGERTPVQAWVGLAISLAGAIIFLLDKRDAGGGSLVGDLLSIVAGISFAIYGIVNRPLVVKYPTATYTAWTLFAGAVPLLLVALPGAIEQPWGSVSTGAWVSIVYLAILPVYVAYIIWNWAISRRGVAQASSFGLLVPIAAGILSAIFLGEPFGPVKLLGGALVLAGLVVVRLPGLPGVRGGAAGG
jgi:drug/metabolite transporter (DMT)-like permease